MRHATRDAESWAFIVNLYAQPGVANACLMLQNVADVDVTMLLTIVFWAVRRGDVPNPDELGELATLCRPWREQIVQPLRQVRVRLKSGPTPAPNPNTDLLRRRIKRDELAAERVENGLLNDWFARRQRPASHATHADIAELVGSAVALSAQPHDGSRGDITRSIDDLVAAIGTLAARSNSSSGD